MIRGIPVIGINNGGPKETIEDKITGYLLELDQSAWATCITNLV